MEFETVIYEVEDGVATVTMNRPDRMNAMTNVMNGEIRAAMQLASDDASVRAIILTGAGRGFCAGADAQRLQNRAEGGAVADVEVDELPVRGAIEGGLQLQQGFGEKYAYLTTVPKPLIAAVNGAAVGVGMVLALYSDIRFASASARFGTAFAKRGLVAEYGLAWLLPKVIGPSKSFDMLYTARLVGAAEAQSIGLVDQVVAEGEDTLAAAKAYAQVLVSEVSPRSNRIIKELVWRGMDDAMVDAMAHSMDETAKAAHSDDFREGIAAWKDKRTPNFTGN